MSAPLKIFIIYAREDRGYKDDLLKSLKLLQTQGLIEPWHDGDIKPGDEWDKEIKARLRAADIILPIISFDFFDSDYIHRVEIVEAFERYDRGEALIIPVIADSCPWMDCPRLKDFQALPMEGRPIDDWPDRKKAMSSIYEGINRIIIEKKNKEEAQRRRQAAIPFLVLGMNATDYSEKILHLSKAIEVDPEYIELYHTLAFLKDQLGQYDEAIKDYDRAILINPEDALAYSKRGWMKYQLGQYDEAIKDFDQAILIDPEDAVTYFNRSVSKVYLHSIESAKKDVRKALSIDPNDKPAKDLLDFLEEKLKQKP